jgi:uncharacterized C2H2 Zn-finger protein
MGARRVPGDEAEQRDGTDLFRCPVCQRVTH